MPNQVNYPDTIPVPYINYRPERLSEEDRNLVQNRIDQIVFGTSPRDHVELWVYDSNGGIAGHTNVPITDASMSLSTVVSNAGAYELLNIDMGAAIRTMVVESGRYGFTANFFRDEVGSEYVDDTKPVEYGPGKRLYIADISDDRTELRLSPKDVSDALLTEIYEWVMPSVPRLYAQALIDQTFGRSFDTGELASDQDAQSIDPGDVLDKLDDVMNIDPSVRKRIDNSGTMLQYTTMMTEMIPAIGIRSLELMYAAQSPATDVNIQQAQLYQFIEQATIQIINEFKSNPQTPSQKIDPRFNVYT